MIEQYAVNIGQAKIEDLSDARRQLSEEKAEKVNRFYFEKDKIRGIVGETLVRCLLCTEYGFGRKEIRFACSENGKPFVETPKTPVEFNLSHSGDWVVCGIGHVPVGIDVEEIQKADDSLARAVLTDAEYGALHALPFSMRDAAFYRYWTAKESYVKYLGVGLGLEFRKISVRPGQDGWNTVGENEACAVFTQMLTPKDVLSVCVSQEHADQLDCAVKRIDLSALIRFSRGGL